MGNIFRVCTTCDEQYEAGTFKAHAKVHTPVRRRIVPVKVHPAWVLELVGQGKSYAQVAREVGLTRERVRQIVQEGRAA